MNGGLCWFLPFALQGLAMAVDEGWFHRRRGVPRLEAAGHALDALGFLVCLACPLALAPTGTNLGLFLILAGGSCLLITKDEFLHQRRCSGGEHWLHAVLFILHPLVLGATALLWCRAGAVPLGTLAAPAPALASGFLRLQVLLVAGFLVFQVGVAIRRRALADAPEAIDNALYDDLGERWYSAQDDPVALLRAEGRLRTPWVVAELRAHFGNRPLAILDVACGGGLLANPLAQAGHRVTAVDLSRDSLAVARRHDPTGSVVYLPMDARRLAFADGQFDAVCMMDFLEHLEEREQVIAEASRVLKPGGWFLFHTFNRTPVSALVAIKGVAWVVRNTPRNLHVYRLFLKPAELLALCGRHRLEVEVLRGSRPRIFTRAFLRLLLTGRVEEDFQFLFTRSLSVGYCGRACLRSNPEPG